MVRHLLTSLNKFWTNDSVELLPKFLCCHVFLSTGTGSPPTELLSAASSALCNLLLEFSPAKEPMLQQGIYYLVY